MISNFKITLAAHHLTYGVIAHPTDTVYGLSCLPSNRQAIDKLLLLKKRSYNKGLILLASNWRYFLPYIDKYYELAEVLKRSKINKRATTYLVNASAYAKYFLTGNFDTIAIRLTNNYLVAGLCGKTNSALVSSSANISGAKPITDIMQLKVFFKNKVDFIITPQKINNKPSIIINLATGEKCR